MTVDYGSASTQLPNPSAVLLFFRKMHEPKRIHRLMRIEDIFYLGDTRSVDDLAALPGMSPELLCLRSALCVEQPFTALATGERTNLFTAAKNFLCLSSTIQMHRPMMKSKPYMWHFGLWLHMETVILWQPLLQSCNRWRDFVLKVQHFALRLLSTLRLSQRTSGSPSVCETFPVVGTSGHN